MPSLRRTMHNDLEERARTFFDGLTAFLKRGVGGVMSYHEQKRMSTRAFDGCIALHSTGGISGILIPPFDLVKNSV